MTATIFTDMSHRNGLTGYAYYIRTERYKLNGSSCFKSENHSYKNELYAVYFALKRLKDYHKGKLTKVYIYCDNQQVINNLISYNKDKTLTPNDKNVSAEIVAFNQKAEIQFHQFDFEIEARKVKAHTNGKCIRTKINNWMDAMAKEARIKTELYLAV